MTLEEELRAFPLTGRFLFGRLRETLSREERELLESLPTQIATFENSTRIVEAGAVSERSTLLVEGFIIRGLQKTSGGGGKRSALSVHVPVFQGASRSSSSTLMVSDSRPRVSVGWSSAYSRASRAPTTSTMRHHDPSLT